MLLGNFGLLCWSVHLVSLITIKKLTAEVLSFSIAVTQKGFFLFDCNMKKL